MTRTATVSISIPKKRYWPKGWDRPEVLPQFRGRDTGGLEVLQNGVWEDIPSQAALHIRVSTCEAGALREAIMKLMRAIEETEHVGNAGLDEALQEADQLI